MADDLELKDLSTFDKIKHKNWKVRVVGCEELLTEMKMLESFNDPLYSRLLEIIKNMVNDGNALAQEKSLEAILYFVQVANVATKISSDLCSGIINRCISSNRNRTKEISFEILKTYIEIEKQNVVIEELIKGFSNKNLKVVIASINVLTESLHDFGPRVLPVKELFKNVHKLLEDRDKNVRDAGKELIIEMYRWLGSSTMGSVLNQLKPVQVTELNAEFEKLPKEKPVPCRYLKSQKPKEGAIVKPTGGGDAVSQQTTVKVQNNVDIDPYDLLDPVEVLSKIPANYYDQIEEKKWTDRKEALEVIEKLTNHGKLVPGEYGDLIKSLLKVLSKDTNIVLVALSGKIIYQIATGLRKKFSPYAVTTIQVCLEKFKEKKLSVVSILRDCVDAVFETATYSACMEEIINALNHKTPSVKTETAHFLNRVFQKSTTESWTGKLLKQIMPPLTNLCLDSTLEVRDAAFETLGTAMKVVTEKKLKPYLDKMDNVKLARINEFYEKAKLKARTLASTESSSKIVVKAVENFSEPKKFEKPAENLTPVNKISQIANESRISYDDVELNTEKFSNNDNDLIEEINPVNNSNEICLEPENVKYVSLSDNMELDADNELDNNNKFDPKTSLFYEVITKSKIINKESLENVTWLQDNFKKLENLDRNMAFLMKNQKKIIINNIFSSDLKTSCYASDVLINKIIENPLILTEYSSFLLTVICKQIILILELRNLDLDILGISLGKILYLLKQIAINCNIMDNLEDKLIIIVMAVLLELSNFVASIAMTNSNITNWISTIATVFYQNTKDKPFTNIIKIVSVKIVKPEIFDVDIFSDLDLSVIVDKFYNKYIQIGGNNDLDSEKLDAELMVHN